LIFSLDWQFLEKIFKLGELFKLVLHCDEVTLSFRCVNQTGCLLNISFRITEDLRHA